ncbi:hypothetical protein BaRGS_00007666 [Batillaria attramentaria]|uniref:Uncharacterized protein n=1 Tax=Batillaria attramentaria TaxID=370345 RepID=A0ABD0LPW0_9CAEN
MPRGCLSCFPILMATTKPAPDCLLHSYFLKPGPELPVARRELNLYQRASFASNENGWPGAARLTLDCPVMHIVLTSLLSGTGSWAASQSL